MSCDKDRPSSWKKYVTGLCTGCSAQCCAMPVEINFDDLLRLGFVSVDDQFISRRKLVKRLMSERKIASYRDHNELFTLASQPSGDCHLLNPKTRLCTVYEKRPHVCREFPSVGPRPGYCPANRTA